MATLIWFIQTYGYLFIFLATVLEGETIVALAGFLAYQGYLNLGYVILTAIIGGVTGDQSFFYFGRLKGKQFLEARPKYAKHMGRVHRLIERHQNWLMFGSRFMYGFRIMLPIAMGTSNIRRAKFLLFNITGATVWAIFFSVGGYAFGNALERFIGHVKKAEKFIIVGVLVGLLIANGVSWFYRQIDKRLEEEAEREEREDESGKKNLT